jgi:aspartate/methionine/tyrosine aminotransferase
MGGKQLDFMSRGPPSDRVKSVFRTKRYRRRAEHIAEMHFRQFATTPVNHEIARIQEVKMNYPVQEVWFGDPARFEGLEAYEGVERFFRRYINFHSSRDYSHYMIRGCPELMEQLRPGTSKPDEELPKAYKHLKIYITSGVAGALRIISPAILLPPDGINRDNVICPKWTYLSHSAEAALALAEIKSCNIRKDGQVDLQHMEKLIDPDTRAIILATVGNPLSIAMKHESFESMLRLVRRKMEEFGHPITVVADVIYEHFRRPVNGERLDAIKKAISMGIDVPIMEVTSFSKMMAMAGQRIGSARYLYDPDGDFRDHVEDVVTALEAVYGTTLCPVPSLIQKSLAKLYSYISAGRPVEEELAPVAAVLFSLKQLTEMKGGGDTHTMMPDEVPAEIVSKLGLDPEIWFTTSAVAKRTRKLAKVELAKYDVDMDTSRVMSMGEKLSEAGLIEVKRVEVERERMIDIVISSVLKHGNIEHKVLAGLQKGLEKVGVSIGEGQQKIVVNEIVAELSGTTLKRMEEGAYEYEELKDDFQVTGNADSRKVVLEFYRLRDPVNIPDIEIEDGQLDLYEISEYAEWVEISNLLGLPTEDKNYVRFKEERRKEIWERVGYFVNRIEEMRQAGLDVYMHESYYDEEGNLVPERIDGFYVLIGFDKLRDHECQAADLVGICVRHKLDILGTTPGELFLPDDTRGKGDSYLRIVALHPRDKMEEVLDVIEDLAVILASGTGSGSLPRQLSLPIMPE